MPLRPGPFKMDRLVVRRVGNVAGTRWGNSVMQTALFILRVFGVLGGLAAVAQGETKKVSRPFEYQGYSAQEYAELTVSSTMAPMSDGVELAVDVYLPNKGPEVRSFPVVLM